MAALSQIRRFLPLQYSFLVLAVTRARHFSISLQEGVEVATVCRYHGYADAESVKRGSSYTEVMDDVLMTEPSGIMRNVA